MREAPLPLLLLEHVCCLWIFRSWFPGVVCVENRLIPSSKVNRSNSFSPASTIDRLLAPLPKKKKKINLREGEDFR